MCVLGLAAIGALLSAMSLPATADEWVEDGHAIQQVSYSTGESGHELKWLPYRPGKVRSDNAVVTAQHLGTLPPVVRLQAAQLDAQPAIQDPFGDRSASQTFDEAGPQPGAQTPPSLFQNIPDGGATLVEPLPAEPAAAAPAEPTRELPYTIQELNVRPAPTIDQALASAPTAGEGKCPLPEEVLKPISKITTDIAPEGDKFPRNCSLGESTFQPRSWAPSTYTWKASGLCHKPLYFEDVQLERYGHSWGPYLQPVISGGHFFLTIPALPYLMGLNPPCECMYTLGYYRPGSCAPYMLDPLPLSVRAGLAEAGVWTGAVFLIP